MAWSGGAGGARDGGPKGKDAPSKDTGWGAFSRVDGTQDSRWWEVWDGSDGGQAAGLSYFPIPIPR